MFGTEEIRQREQRCRIENKYSIEPEYEFWSQFAEKGLTDLEEQAVHGYLEEGSRLLNIGCGCGREAAALEGLRMEVWALDLVRRLAQTAHRHLESLGLPARVVCADVTEGVPFAGKFDAAVLFEQVYQHIPDRRARSRCLESLRAALKPNGLLLLSAFNEGDIDLWARILWMRDTKWQLADMAVEGANLLNARYSDSAEGGSGAGPRRRFHLRRVLWVLAYIRFLIRRIRLSRHTLRRAEIDERACCKSLHGSNPQSDSDGWFWFRVMSLPELSVELKQAGFHIERVYPLLGDRYKCAQRSAWGAPLVLVVARAAKRDGDE